MKQNEIILNADRVFLMIEFTETIIQNREASAENEFNHVIMSATFFTNLIQKKEEKQKKIEVFLTSMHQQVERPLSNISEDILTQSAKTPLRAHFKHNSLTQSA